MSRQLAELESVLSSLIAEQKRLLTEVDRHQDAIKTMNSGEIESSQAAQEVIRARIAGLDGRRALLASQLGSPHKVSSPTLTKLAELYPQARARLLAQRDELRDLIVQVQQRNQVAGRVAGAMLRHLNTVVRLLAGAMQQAGVYTKRGLPKMAPRIGVIEAVG
jgi:hypothetical protein